MKSTWVWIIAITFAIWLFSDNKKSKSAVSTFSPPSLFVPSTFSDYPCTIDCSGHETGYEWAEENSIDDPDDCVGKSNSFIEGCESYVEEQQLNLVP